MSEQSDILVVGQTPPPHHGQAVVTSMLFDHEWSKVRVECLRMAYSKTIESVGSFSISKVFYLFSLIFQTWKIVLSKRPHALYYLPSSPNKIPLIRDLVYLSFTRCLFPKTVFHYHAGGLAEFVEGLGLLKYFAHKAYGGADMSIELSENGVSPSDYFRAKQKVYIPNGLDVEVIYSSKAAREDCFTVLFIGALNEGKGVGQIVNTASILSERGVKVKFSLVGAWADESYKEEVLNEIAQKRLTEIFEFPGVLTGDSKWGALCSADCFLFPSHYSSESFPLVLIEAMACRLPIVTTRWRGIPNVVGDCGCAVLCDVKSSLEYAEVISELVENSYLRNEMGLKARRRYESEFTRQKFLSRMEDAFCEVVKSA